MFIWSIFYKDRLFALHFQIFLFKQQNTYLRVNIIKLKIAIFIQISLNYTSKFSRYINAHIKILFFRIFFYYYYFSYNKKKMTSLQFYFSISIFCFQFFYSVNLINLSNIGLPDFNFISNSLCFFFQAFQFSTLK